MNIKKVIDNLLSRYQMYLTSNPEFVKINASITFPIRTKCKSCMNGPKFYYIQKMPALWFDPNQIKRNFDRLKKSFKSMNQDFYLMESPKFFTGISPFNFTPRFNHYNPTLHAKNGVLNNNILEFLACECGFTTWAFSRKSTQNRPEITKRKAPYSYPHKFDDWY